MASAPPLARASAIPLYQQALLAWYDRHQRPLPWRKDNPGDRHPYEIWLCEVMAQQTTLPAVIPYYRRFLSKWPAIADLAAAKEDEILTAWQGLGYYARARNLHRTAKEIVTRHGGKFPQDEETLLALPGIGRYIAAAIAAFAFDQPAVVVDGNVERVMGRLFAIRQPLKDARKALFEAAARLTPKERPGDYAGALMDLAHAHCRPRQPRCGGCPVQGFCQAAILGLSQELPAKPVKRPRPLRHGVAFFAHTPDGHILLRRRPPKGLLGGMAEIPSTPWEADPWTRDQALTHAPLPGKWTIEGGAITHIFSHFALELRIVLELLGPKSRRPRLPEGLYWRHIDALAEEPLPSVMKKVIMRAQATHSEGR